MTRFCRHLLLGPLLLRPVAVVAALLVGGTACVHTRATPPPPETIAPTKPDHEQAVETGIPVASTPQGLLRAGAEKRIQSRLHARGLLRPEQVNGQLDGVTRQALRKFQKSEGLPATGLPSYETVERLGLKLDEIFHTTRRPRDPTAADLTDAGRRALVASAPWSWTSNYPPKGRPSQHFEGRAALFLAGAAAKVHRLAIGPGETHGERQFLRTLLGEGDR
jgi:hypothetical protein